MKELMLTTIDIKAISKFINTMTDHAETKVEADWNFQLIDGSTTPAI